ncbi:hypothetical protein [Sphingomonas sanxanigenens]|uniref:Nucleotide-diphospho-sugar transferase domain-containing protein n=1 Tax=Sphingomonas sanxanigenens DSM 19645 = NX02 TaxID=1123269 RepID=W0A8V6_9SPHN|nr:hypothetical protein [Sphingomonas sanxanigenens]AHE53496.1 hypothetical protein NX02_08865 [Sphingomonas sanxanigenens DSM 19645 = NX02]
MPPITILQAYEAPSLPGWIARCLDSVRQWAAARSYGYAFTDRFFEAVPDWFRAICGPQTGPMTDIARLVLMQRLFDRGAGFVVWIDADVLIFDPDSLAIDATPGFFGIRERALLLDRNRCPTIGPENINGAILGSAPDDPRFATYRWAVEEIVRRHTDGPIPRTIAGPQLLTRMATRHPFPAIDHVGLLTPAMIAEIAAGGSDLCGRYMAAFGSPLAAANLCHFYRDAVSDARRRRFDDAMDRAITLLVETRGAVVNDLLADGDACAPTGIARSEGV